MDCPVLKLAGQKKKKKSPSLFCRGNWLQSQTYLCPKGKMQVLQWIQHHSKLSLKFSTCLKASFRLSSLNLDNLSRYAATPPTPCYTGVSQALRCTNPDPQALSCVTKPLVKLGLCWSLFLPVMSGGWGFCSIHDQLGTGQPQADAQGGRVAPGSQGDLHWRLLGKLQNCTSEGHPQLHVWPWGQSSEVALCIGSAVCLASPVVQDFAGIWGNLQESVQVFPEICFPVPV